ncbi:MAG: 4a-hydroxytetrahydrobiopterin dehydratase [Flavobacteriales bacterium]|nr:4a-hydroxytetrahydrobiopterin dehydratase [Flavobacteriales bacterium]
MGTWTERNDRLERSFKFKDFSEAFAFMTRVAMAAEKLGHHPTWTNTWNTVDIALNTHDAGGVVTAKDHALAKAIDRVAGGKKKPPVTGGLRRSR